MAISEPKQQSCGCSSNCCSTISDEQSRGWQKYLPAIISFFMLSVGLLAGHLAKLSFFSGYVELVWYVLAYLPVAVPVLKEAGKSILNKDFFNEFTLMSLATLGAFFIREYPEAVAVMLFYSVGELFQDAAVNKAKRNIKALLDIRPDSAMVLRNGSYLRVSPSEVTTGETIQIKAGEKVPLDGVMQSGQSSFNTAALTGESKPRTIRKGEAVLAGMINLDKVIEVRVEKTYQDSTFVRILTMVQEATSRKAKTELLIRRFARIYTPIVFFLAIGITLLPALFISGYVFETWLYRALVFLVISCPCALVVSIPLGYFGGIGAASRNGILFKGANYLDRMPFITTLVMDKTGTLTKGVFDVQDIVTSVPDKQRLMSLAGSIESQSGHPIAKAILDYCITNKVPILPVTDAEEIAGHGLKAMLNGQPLLAGNTKLMDKYGISYDEAIKYIPETVVVIALNNQYIGHILIADELKEDAAFTVAQLKKNGINTLMLSGDKKSIVEKTAQSIGIDEAYGDLLPQDKVAFMERLKAYPTGTIAFVGDGINDAPVLAMSDIGIAMGAIGADAAIEIADVVIQTDEPSKIVTAINISKYTRRIVKQNIAMAIGVKIAVMALGAVGIASMWGAVFADVGVALLAILNAVRVLSFRSIYQL